MRPGLLASILLAIATVAGAEEPKPYPAGKSVQMFAGLRFHLEVPKDLDAEKEVSLIVGLHGADAGAREFGTWWEPLVPKDFIVCCPKSTGNAWNKRDIDAVRKIVRHLMERYRVGEGRLHAVGFSNGGAHLVFLVMDPKLPFASVCWMGSGFSGGKVPSRARKGMAAIALCGSLDQAYGAASKTPDLLRGKVRWAEFHEQLDLAHAIPNELMPYYYYWLLVMEGRFEPGEDAYFDWCYDLSPVKDEMKEDRRGALVLFYRLGDKDNADAKHTDHVVLFDPLVRHFGKQAIPIMLDVDDDKELFAALGFTKTPAIAVLDPDAEPVATFEGRIEAKAVAKALRAVARNKAFPRR